MIMGIINAPSVEQSYKSILSLWPLTLFMPISVAYFILLNNIDEWILCIGSILIVVLQMYHSQE